MMICLMIYAVAAGHFPLFAIAAVVGVLGRETCIFAVPLWLTKDLRQGVAAILMSSAVVLAPRLLMSDGADAFSLSFVCERTSIHLSYLADIFYTWRSAWLIAIAGICLLAREGFLLLAPALIALLVGAFLTSLVAADLGRMFAILAPLIALGSAQFVTVLTRAGRKRWGLLLIGLAFLESIFKTPNALVDKPDHPLLTLARPLSQLAGMLVSLAAIGLIRRDLVTTFWGNWASTMALIRGKGRDGGCGPAGRGVSSGG